MKVFIGLPIYSFEFCRVVSGIFSLVTFSYESIPDLHLEIYTPRRLKYSYALSKIAQKFLRTDFEYLLLTCDDICPPKKGLKRLLETNKDVVSGIYFSAFFPYMPLAWIKDKEMGIYKNVREFFKYELMQVDSVRCGFLLLKRKVVEDIYEDVFNFDDYKIGDHYISEGIKKAGYDIWLDTTVKCGHVGENGKLVTEEDYLRIYNTYLRKLEEESDKNE